MGEKGMTMMSIPALYEIQMTTIKRALMTFSEIVIISAVNLWPGSVTNREFEHNVSCAPLCDTMLYACSTGSICNTIFNLTNVPFAPYKFLLLWFSFFTWRLDETHELQYFLVKTRPFPRSKCSNSWYCYYPGNYLRRSVRYCAQCGCNVLAKFWRLVGCSKRLDW